MTEATAEHAEALPNDVVTGELLDAAKIMVAGAQIGAIGVSGGSVAEAGLAAITE